MNIKTDKVASPGEHFESQLYSKQKNRAIFYLANPLHKKRLWIISNLIERIAKTENKHLILIDLGSGEGELEERIKHLKNVTKVAVDVSEEALNVGLNHERFNTIAVADIERSLEKVVSKNSADIVVAAEILEHLKHPGIFIKKKIRPILKKDGYFIGSVPNMAQLHDILGLISGLGSSYQTTRPLTDITSGHVAFFSIHSLRKVLESAGFKNIKIVGNGVRLKREGDTNLFFLSKLPFFKNFSDRFIFCCTKSDLSSN